MRQLNTFHPYFLSASSSALLCFSSGHLSFNSLSVFSRLSSCYPQMNSMNNVSSSEDIKPPPGLQNLGNINYQCTSPGGMSKHICSICGDRSSGNVRDWGWGRGMGKQIYTPTHHKHRHPDDWRQDNKEIYFKVSCQVYECICWFALC